MSGLQVYQAGGQGVVTAQFPPVQSPRDPTTSDKAGTDGSSYSLLRQWINTTTQNTFIYLGSGIWVQFVNSSGDVAAVNGTANQITANTVSGTATLSLPAAIIAPGSIAATTTLTATLGNITATNGNLVLNTSGNKLVINATTPTTASVGTTAAMSGSGAVTITSSAITDSSKIIYSRRLTGGTTGDVSITAQAGGSATLTSTSATETSTFDYLIIN